MIQGWHCATALVDWFLHVTEQPDVLTGIEIITGMDNLCRSQVGVLMGMGTGYDWATHVPKYP